MAVVAPAKTAAPVVNYVLPAKLPQTGAGGMDASALPWMLAGLLALAVMVTGATLRVRRWLHR